jgi:NAD(P)-dependent dehydrogenase (short-subunit alcohol dehydrogenase family)
MGRMEDRVAVVTGAGDGIGRGVARRFARESAKVVVAEIDESAGKAAASELAPLGGLGLFVRTDVTKKADVVAAIDAAVSEFGRVDVLVNNAISLSPGLLLEQKTDDMLQHSLEVGLWATWWGMQAAFPHMRSIGGGSIINFRSLDGEVGHWLHSDYNVTKEAIGGLTRSAAAEWGRFNIRVNAITPAAATRAHKALEKQDPERLDKIVRSFPLGRVGDPEEDVGGGALFLATDDSRYVTGITLYVDGGIHLPRYDTKPYDLLSKETTET